MRHRLLWAFGFSFEKKNGFVCFCCCSFFRECRARFHWTTFFFIKSKLDIRYRVLPSFDQVRPFVVGGRARFYWVFTELYWVFDWFVGTKKIKPSLSFSLISGFTGFLFNVARWFYHFYLVVLGFTKLYWVFTKFYWVLPSFTGFYLIALGFTGFYLVLLGFTGFH